MKKLLTSALALSFFAVIGCGDAPKKVEKDKKETTTTTTPTKETTTTTTEKEKKP